MSELHVLRVFVNEDGEWGNRLGVFLDGGAVPETERQRIAAALGFSETVFVADRAAGRIRIHTPEVELPFAGHPTVGAAWLLNWLGTPVETLRPPAGEVGVRMEDGIVWVDARPEWAPPFEYRQLANPADVRALDGPPGSGNVYAWAWIDEAAGTIRARAFVPEAGIAEDEATGSAALALCARLGRPLTVHQGHGSLLLARPAAGGLVEVGGRVHLDEVRDWPLPQAPQLGQRGTDLEALVTPRRLRPAPRGFRTFFLPTPRRSRWRHVDLLGFGHQIDRFRARVGGFRRRVRSFSRRVGSSLVGSCLSAARGAGGRDAEEKTGNADDPRHDRSEDRDHG